MRCGNSSTNCAVLGSTSSVEISVSMLSRSLIVYLHIAIVRFYPYFGSARQGFIWRIHYLAGAINGYRLSVFVAFTGFAGYYSVLCSVLFVGFDFMLIDVNSHFHECVRFLEGELYSAGIFVARLYFLSTPYGNTASLWAASVVLFLYRYCSLLRSICLLLFPLFP